MHVTLDTTEHTQIDYTLICMLLVTVYILASARFKIYTISILVLSVISGVEIIGVVIMNIWTCRSIEFANSNNYLDELYRVYPIEPDIMRSLDENLWERVTVSFKRLQDDMGDVNKQELINALLDLDLFPIKDSYVAYLRRDRTAIIRNPQTIARLIGRINTLGIEEIYKLCSQPKETNRQIGPLFRNWINKGGLGYKTVRLAEFETTNSDCILDATDAEMMHWCSEKLGYSRDKGLDFVARINGKYVIGEAKFLTDFGGHQNAQLEDALSTLRAKVDAVKLAILDGVIYIENSGKMYRTITGEFSKHNILSALLLPEFLATIK